MSKKIDATFVIPVKDGEEFITEALNSCLTQSHKSIEVLVVDDGSTDGTMDVVKWYASKDSRIRLITNDSPGRGQARNYGIVSAESNLIMVLDADDVAEKDRTKRTLDYFRNTEDKHPVLHGAANMVDYLCRTVGRLPGEPFDMEKMLKRKLYENGITHSTMAYKRDTLATFSVWYDSGEYAEMGLDDWKFQVDLAVVGAKFHALPNMLCAYRIHDGGISHTREQAEMVALKKKYLLQKCLIKEEVNA